MSQENMDSNPLYRWLKEHGYWITGKDDERTKTHYFLDGGKAAVPAEASDEFLEVYSKSLGTPQYVVESRTPLFRMFMDLDFKAPEEVPNDLVLKICKAIFQHAMTFFEGTKSHLIVCKAPARMVKDSMKTGVHVHFTDVFVTSGKAMAFRNACISEFLKRPDMGDFKWQEVFDLTVFKSSGLRMMGSIKRDGPGFYWPYCIIRDIVTVDFLEENTVRDNLLHWIHMTSIRVPHGFESRSSSELEQLQKTFDKGILKRLDPDRYVSLVSGFRSVVPKTFYKNLKVTGAYEIDTNGSNKVFVVGTDCKNCMNKINGRHSSNHVYFIVDSRGVFQKCFCRCETMDGRRFGTCKNFSNKISDLTDDLNTLVYGEGLGHSSRPWHRCDSVKNTVETILKCYQ
jgi:hypothetical protein